MAFTRACLLRMKDAHGIAAVEFALMAPILLLLFLGGFELNRYILINHKLEKVAYSVSDVVAQSTSVTTAQLNQILAAAGEIMDPYAFNADGVVLISSVYKSEGVPATVRWRHSGGGTLLATSRIGAVGATATLPDGLTLNDRENIIIAEVFYQFRPVFEVGNIGAADLYKIAIFKPRLGALITTPN